MGAQLSGLNETFIAIIACVGTFTGMSFIVAIQCFLGRKTLSTLNPIQKIFGWVDCLLFEIFEWLTVEHEYGFSPVWDRRCLRSAPFDGNDLSHKSHANGWNGNETDQSKSRNDLFGRENTNLFTRMRSNVYAVKKKKNKPSDDLWSFANGIGHFQFKCFALTWVAMNHKMIWGNAGTDNRVSASIGQCAREDVHEDCRF